MRQFAAFTDAYSFLSAKRPWLWYALAAIVVGAELAKWTWILLEPRQLSLAIPSGQGALSDSGNLFGKAETADTSAHGAIILPNAKLVGVFAGSPGFAILELDGQKQIGVTEGGDIVPGAKLLEIAADHVVVESNGGRQQIDLVN